MHLGEREYSPDLQHKIAETSARVKSFEQAAAVAEIWSGQVLSSRHLGRVVEEVGDELVVKRDAGVDDFTHHRRQVEGDDPQHELAAVFVDGGRVQLRDETPGVGPGVHGEHWQEDKIARVQTMTVVCHSVDPCPEPPACFRKSLLASGASPSTPSPDSPAISGGSATEPDAEPAEAPRRDWHPKPLVRTCVGTMRGLDDFRWMVQAEAKRRHFFTARKRAFVADGSHGNWTLWQRHFPDFVPILDFLHAAESLHAAAKALGSETLGCAWVREIWQGRNAEAIRTLREKLDAQGIGLETLDEKHAYYAVQRAWTYLTNSAGKMDYPRYRREGLPTTSSLVESQIKEFNARLKGSEKFWHESNAESMLQLICKTLNEEGPTLADHFDTRSASPFRRSYPAKPAPLKCTADQTIAA